MFNNVQNQNLDERHCKRSYAYITEKARDKAVRTIYIPYLALGHTKRRLREAIPTKSFLLLKQYHP